MTCFQTDLDLSLISDATFVDESPADDRSIISDHRGSLEFEPNYRFPSDQPIFTQDPVDLKTTSFDKPYSDITKTEHDEITSVTVLPTISRDSREYTHHLLNKDASKSNFEEGKNLYRNLSSTSPFNDFQPQPTVLFDSSSNDSASNSVAFFRTSDHLPRAQLEMPSNELELSTEFCSELTDSPTPRNHPISANIANLSLTPETGSTSSIETVDNRISGNKNCSTEFATVQPNSTNIILNRMKEIAQRLSRKNQSLPTEQARREAAKLINEACASFSFYNGPDGPILNPGITVNIPEQTCTFNSLMDLSVDQSEIVRQEREKVAKQRKRLAQMRKKFPKEIPTPPDLLEFFDPNRHIYQSVNLHIPSPMDTTSFTPCDQDDLTWIFHERQLLEFSLLND